jgi:CDP-diacylglycerol pyrophosphatase
MMRIHWRWCVGTWGALAGLAVAGMVVAAVSQAMSLNRTALWVFVHGICVPNWQQQHRPDPCASVDLRSGIDQGTAALINPMAKSEALVVPTRPISGIESPDLLQDDAPDLFGAAWNARHLVFHRLGKTLPRDGIGLAINSQLSRSQDLAHIHVDCLRLDVRRPFA